MATKVKTIENEISTFLKVNAEKMLDNNYKDDGTTYFHKLENNLSIVLCFDDENNLEASIRVSNSSYFVWDWAYVDEGAFVGLGDVSKIDGIVKYFMDYIKREEKRSNILEKVSDIMFDESLKEYFVEKEDGSSICCKYNARNMDLKVFDENGIEITWNVDLDLINELYEDLKSSCR